MTKDELIAKQKERINELESELKKISTPLKFEAGRVCDRCGKDINEKDWSMSLENSSYGGSYTEGLCYDCNISNE